jgi:drug/metabolite transporter (DMT)-like permease
MAPAGVFGILSGLASALVWGTGDFIGGVAARRSTQFQVVALSSLAAVCLMVPATVLAGEAFPSSRTVAWSLAAGLSGAVGVAALYQGLATGAAAVVAPTSAVTAAAVPVITGSIVQGLPPPTDLAGIVFGLSGIWLVSNLGQAERPASASVVSLGLLAGLGFGGFFVMIAQVDPSALFAPLVIVKVAALAFGLIAVAARREGLPSLRSNPLALLTGVFDTAGNLFFLLAARATSLPVAGVLSSMYPAVTVALSVLLFRERVGRGQAAGVVLCVAAVILISLGP